MSTEIDNETKSRDKVPSLKSLYVISGIFSAMALLAFCWQKPLVFFNRNYVADTNLLGTLGDFLGGILGSVFSLVSCVLLVKTLRIQQKENRANFEELELQRFNNIFFELLRLYQKEVAELSSTFIEKTSNGISKSRCTYKDFFFIEKLKFQKTYNCKGRIQERVEEGRQLYKEFYLNNCSIAHCYRSLYRIYCIIEDAKIAEKDKKEYIKILRAQLTESELFFLRYNANSFHGQKFKKILNKYNVLKHLPLCDLVEFKKYWESWSELEKESINTVFSIIIGAVRKLLTPRKTRHSIIILDSTKYSINIECEQFHKITIKINIDNKISRCNKELSAFDNMSSSQIASLLKDYLVEIFYYRTYGMANNYFNFKVTSNIVRTENKIEMVSATISNIKNEPLNLFVKQSPLYVDLAQ